MPSLKFNGIKTPLFTFLLSWLTCFSLLSEEKLEELRPFLNQYCISCHGPDKQKNDLRFDTLPVDLSKKSHLQVWQMILDQLNLGEMPPKKKAQPTEKESQEFIEKLSFHLKEAYTQLQSRDRKTTLRRLNRIEFRNTLRDLLYLQGPDFTGGVAKLIDNNGNGRVEKTSNDPIRDFPQDEQDHGFDTIGERLVMSDFLLKLVITAAEEALGLATHFEPQPKVEKHTFAGHIRTRGPNAGLESWARDHFPDHDSIFQRYREPGASTGGSGRVSPDKLAGRGVGVGARYRITIEASAHHQKHPWGDLLKNRQDQAFQLGLHLADTRRGGYSEGNPTNKLVKQWDMPGDGNRHVYTFETWLDPSWTAWMGWENAPYERSLRASQLVKKYYPDAWKPQPSRDAPNEVKRNYEPSMAKVLFEKGYLGPHIRIHKMEFEPLIETWPPKSHVFLYGEEDDLSIEDLLQRFSQRAYRREVKKEEILPYIELVKNQIQSGISKPEALKLGYTALLASPRFYYLEETSQDQLGAYELATRLSYFLWSSMPDDELFKLAQSKKILQPKVLAQQVERMLSDSKSASFYRRFTQVWLRLDKLGSMPPEQGGPFRIYWDRQMEPQMVLQTIAFFKDLLQNNGPIRNFIDSDYTFLNERVAFILYDRKDVWGDGFRKVKVKDPRRGGILTQPSVMTATANGVDTSPIVRGVWLLENILGTPPSPPPPDVEPLSPDLRGAKTLKEQLEQHRKVEACSGCHQKIDPYGFAFENYNPIGKWRTHYSKPRKPIDSSSELGDGTPINDIVALKKLLLKREGDVVRCLTQKMLTYASGRRLEILDRPEVERIVKNLSKNGNRLRDLVHEVVQSSIFKTK